MLVEKQSGFSYLGKKKKKWTPLRLLAVNEDVFVCNLYVICIVFLLFGFHHVHLFKVCSAQTIFVNVCC